MTEPTKAAHVGSRINKRYDTKGNRERERDVHGLQLFLDACILPLSKM